MKSRGNQKKPASHPLLSWDIISLGTLERQRLLELLPLYHLRDQYHWQIDIHDLLRVKFDAIVVTDIDQKIQWVSKGFESMTGYNPTEATGRKPSFLQGPESSQEVKRHIRDHIERKVPVEGVLTNYKKNGASYLCSISIMPILDSQNAVTHFIALETETTRTGTFP